MPFTDNDDSSFSLESKSVSNKIKANMRVAEERNIKKIYTKEAKRERESEKKVHKEKDKES